MTTKMREYVSRYQSLPDEQSKIEALFILLGGLGECLDHQIGPNVPRGEIIGVMERTLELAGCGVTGNPSPGIAGRAVASASGLENPSQALEIPFGQARSDSLGNDLFWDIYADEVDGIIRWSGYNDGNWWEYVSTTDQFQIKTGKSGWKYRLNPRTCEVTRTPPR